MAIAAEALSVAALRGSPVEATSGRELGRLHDVEFFWSEEGFPRVVSLVVKRHRATFLADAQHILTLSPRGSVVTKDELRPYVDDPAKWCAGVDLLDHQLLDIAGAHLVRVSDVYLQRVGEEFAFLGVDVSSLTFFRRMLPKAFWRHAQPRALMPWTAIQPFGRPGGAVQTSTQREQLNALSSQQLAVLLDGLSKAQRESLLPSFPKMRAEEASELVSAMTLARRRSRLWSGRQR